MVTKINLLPWREEYRKWQRKKFLYQSLITAVISLISILIVKSMLMTKISEETGANQILQRQEAMLTEKINNITAKQQEQSKYQSINQQQDNLVTLLEELSVIMPNNMHLTMMKLDGKQLHLTGKTENERAVYQFIKSFDAAPVLSDLTVQHIILEDHAASMSTFNLQLQLSIE